MSQALSATAGALVLRVAVMTNCHTFFSAAATCLVGPLKTAPLRSREVNSCSWISLLAERWAAESADGGDGDREGL